MNTTISLKKNKKTLKSGLQKRYVKNGKNCEKK